MTRKPGLPRGYWLQDMADDYATMIREEFGEPIDVIGLSTGGSLCQHLAADHLDLVRRLVIHSSAYTLGAVGKRVQVLVAHHARRRDWQAAYATMFALMLPDSGAMRVVGRPAVWLGTLLAGALAAPKSPSDLVVTIGAEDTHDFRDRLAEITAPTLVVGGNMDPFYSEALFRDTASGIPGARLIVYPGVGHPASGRQFGRDVLAFLREGGLDQGHDARPPRLSPPLPV